MINKFMKMSGQKAYAKDLKRIDRSFCSERVLRVEDINYKGDGDPEHTLDIYHVEDGVSKPVLIDIHGGGFISYDKDFDLVYANVMAGKGFVVAEVNVRLAYPEYTVFDQIEDIDSAVRWIRDNAAEYGGDAGRLYIAGHSSGCVLAVAEALASEDPDMCSTFGFEAKDYKYSGLLLDCGLLHFYKTSIAYNGMRNMVFPKSYKEDPRYRYLVFEKNENIKKLPKTVLVTNGKDVLHKMTYHFEEILKENGVEHKLFDKGSLGHTGLVFKPVSEDFPVLDEAVRFLT